MLGTYDRYQLYVVVAFGIPIGFFLLLDVIKRYDTNGMVLVAGKIIREIPDSRIRPVVEIKVDNKPVRVRARLMMDTMRSLPRQVTFYYDGDPSHEVHCIEETNPLWFLLAIITFPSILLIWDAGKRKRDRDESEAESIFRGE